MNITNTSNRLLASAVRLTVEPVLAPHITDRQRGFLPGRSMIANIVDVDEAMLETAIEEEGAYTFFFDFAAAFPSIEPALLHGFFAHLGWPPWLRQFIRALYWNNHCHLVVGGSRFAGFVLSRGIRQGCPLSPLLFAAASDLFLRRLQRQHPRATLRAWADDLAMVLADALTHLPALHHFFEELGRISGLWLNVA